MDRLIRRFDSVADGALVYCTRRGVAYQRDFSLGFKYEQQYFDHFASLRGSEVEKALNAGRLAMLARHARPGSTLLDVGIGSGAFLDDARAQGFEAKGIDVNPVALDLLRSKDLLAESPRGFGAVTFWDSIEHIAEPERLLRRIERDATVLVALPIFENLDSVPSSKHYKPGEHLYYWTRDGFVEWMAAYGFRLLEESTHEVDAGREGIGAFAFRKDLPGHDEHVALYREMHSTRYYGHSATGLYLDMVGGIVRALKPASILDFGCGRSDLAAHFWADGARTIARYDPAIPQYRLMPEGRFDLTLCCDVLEHIPLASVDSVLEAVKKKSDAALFTISLKLARAKLPDGRNSHVTILSRSEWTRWIIEYFGEAAEVPSSMEHELILIGGRRKIPSRKLHPCHCGGEVMLDSFNPIKRPVEWFIRCRKCGSLGAPHATEDAAVAAWSSSTTVRLRAS